MIKASETTGILLDNKFCVQKKKSRFFFSEALEKAYNKETAVDWN